MVQLNLNFPHTCKHTFSACKSLKYGVYPHGCTQICHVIKYLSHTIDMHHTSKFITSACLVSQQTHKACDTSRATLYHELHMAHQTFMTWISSSWAQLQHNHCNIKESLICTSCQNNSQFWNGSWYKWVYTSTMHLHVHTEMIACKIASYVCWNSILCNFMDEGYVQMSSGLIYIIIIYNIKKGLCCTTASCHSM